MGNSEPSLSSNALDLMLKYSAAFLAVAYALGYSEHLSFTETVGAGAVSAQLADSSYFIQGVLTELFCVLASVMTILSFELLNRAVPLVFDRPAPKWTEHLHEQKHRLFIIGVQTIIAFGVMLIVGRLGFDLSFRWTAVLAVACSAVQSVGVRDSTQPRCLRLFHSAAAVGDVGVRRPRPRRVLCRIRNRRGSRSSSTPGKTCSAANSTGCD